MINAYTIMMGIVIFMAILLKGNRKQAKLYIAFSIIVMFVLLGLRDCYSIGNDSSTSYLHAFERMKTTSWEELRETPLDDNILFHMLMKAVYEASKGDYQVFIIIISAFVMICLGNFVYKYSVNPLQSFCYYWGLLIYTLQFNVLKQSIAMAFVLLAFDAIVAKKLIRFVVLVFLGALFHFPALVFLPAYFISKMRMDKGYLIMLAGMLAITFIFRDKLVDMMTDVYATELQEELTRRFLSNKALIMIVIVVAALVLRPPTQEDELYCKLLSFMGIAIVFQTFCAYNNTFERLADYYFQFSIIFIPLVFEKKPVAKSFVPPELQGLIKTFAPILFCAFGVWRFNDSIMNDIYMFPYRFMNF